MHAVVHPGTNFDILRFDILRFCGSPFPVTVPTRQASRWKRNQD
jgi:hypothetical protein